VAKNDAFPFKDTTAINLFVRDLPRHSIGFGLTSSRNGGCRSAERSQDRRSVSKGHVLAGRFESLEQRTALELTDGAATLDAWSLTLVGMPNATQFQEDSNSDLSQESPITSIRMRAAN